MFEPNLNKLNFLSAKKSFGLSKASLSFVEFVVPSSKATCPWINKVYRRVLLGFFFEVLGNMSVFNPWKG